MVDSTSLVPTELIEKRIYLIRGQKVMLDSDLAELYGVETKALNRAAKRNIDRFPNDFMFQLLVKEAESLRCQIGTLKSDDSPKRGKHRKYLPYVFTEQGVAMLSSVLRSKRAAQVNVQIMRTFVQLRQMIASNSKLAQRLDELENRMDRTDDKVKVIFTTIKKLMQEPAPKKKRNPIGFKASKN